MDKAKLVWFTAGLMLGLGVLLGATVTRQDGAKAGDSGRFQVMEVDVYITGEKTGGDSKKVLLVDTKTGKTHNWALGINAGEAVSFWAPIATAEEFKASRERDKK
jgi:hypothetical protein